MFTFNRHQSEQYFSYLEKSCLYTFTYNDKSTMTSAYIKQSIICILSGTSSMHESKYAGTLFIEKMFPSETGEIYHWFSGTQLLADVHATYFRCQKYELRDNSCSPSFLSKFTLCKYMCSCLLLE